MEKKEKIVLRDGRISFFSFLSAGRKKNGVKYYFVLNYSGECAAVGIKRPVFSLFDGIKIEKELVLEPFGTAVLKNV